MNVIRVTSFQRFYLVLKVYTKWIGGDYNCRTYWYHVSSLAPLSVTMYDYFFDF